MDMADQQVCNVVRSVQKEWGAFQCAINPRIGVCRQDRWDCARRTAETVRSWRMSAVAGHGEELHIPRENCPAVPFAVAGYGWLAVQMPLVCRASCLLLWGSSKNGAVHWWSGGTLEKGSKCCNSSAIFCFVSEIFNPQSCIFWRFHIPCITHLTLY
jgi:hypothetical protein